MVFDSVAYKAVVYNGLVLDKDGNKMSKRLGNAVNPFEAIEQTGSDPLRWYMIANSSPWDNLKFDINGVKEVSRKLFATLHNTYGFFALYANVDNFDNAQPQVPMEKRPEIDRWIISLLNTLIQDVDSALEDYEPTKAARAINEFVNDNLSNWYVRLNRKRFWGGEMTDDKLAAFQTLYTCLETVALLIAPIAPFYADQLYLDLTTVTKGDNATSVHLADFPTADESLIDKRLEKNMKTAQTITSMVLALRRKVNIKVRQPLTSIMIPVVDDGQRQAVEAVSDLIRSEVNVKEIKIADNSEGILVKRVKPDFKKLGPKHGKEMKLVASAIQQMTQTQIAELEREGSIMLDINGNLKPVDLADVEVISEDIPGWLVANEGNVTIALDVTVTPELKREGLARELVNRIQNIRKNRDYNITDRIKVVVDAEGDMADAVRDFNEFISRQILASTLKVGSVDKNDQDAETLEIDENDIFVSITR